MAILASFFAGDSTAIRQCLDSSGWPPDEPGAKCVEQTGFKLSLMPDQSFQMLINAAAQITKTESFQFGDCVSGRLDENGENFQGTVRGRFVDYFAEFPDHLVPELSTRWAADLDRLHEAEFPKTERRRNTWLQRVGSGIRTTLFGAVMFPLLALCLLSPSFRRERAKNKEKLAEKKGFTPPPVVYWISALIKVCAAARERHDVVVYQWHI